MAAKFDLVKRFGGAAQLRDAAERSPDVKEQIEVELAELKGIAPERCVVTQEYRATLRAALA